MIFDYDYFSRFENPVLTLCHPDDTPIGILTHVEGLKITPKFNEVSTLGFTISKISAERFIPTVVTSTTEGLFYTYNVPTGKTVGTYDPIELFGVGNDLTKTYYTKEVEYNPAFDEIIERREILVEDVGYFIITDVRKTDDYGMTVEVTASSCDYELNNYEAPNLDGTYRLYSSDNWEDDEPVAKSYNYVIDLYVTGATVGIYYIRENDEFVAVSLPSEYSSRQTYYKRDTYTGSNCLLYEIMSHIPHWHLKQSLEHGLGSEEYEDLASEYRTFTSDDSLTIYSFLKTQLQQSYECFVKFDYLNREIEILKYTDALKDTDFVLSKSNVINQCTIKTTIDDYTNALNVSASDSEVNMSSVNPTGTNVIYNFKHDLDSQFIINKFEEATVTSATTGVYFVNDSNGYHAKILPGEYESGVQYYSPTSDSTLGAILTAWQEEVHNSSVSYHGIDHDKWDSWVKEIERIQKYVAGDYYITTNTNGSYQNGSLLVVSQNTDIESSIEQTKTDSKVWTDALQDTYKLSHKPEELTSVKRTRDGTETTLTNPEDYTYDSSTGTITFTTLGQPIANDKIEVKYDVKAAIYGGNIGYYYHYYKVNPTVGDPTTGLYVKGDYNFEACSTPTVIAGVEYFMPATFTYDPNNISGSLINYHVVKNDYIQVTPNDDDDPSIVGVQTFYSWNGSKFIEETTGKDNTAYYVRVGSSQAAIANSNGKIMSWVSQNKTDLADDALYKQDMLPTSSSYVVCRYASDYSAVTPDSPYGKIYYGDLTEDNCDDDLWEVISDLDPSTLETNPIYVSLDLPEYTFSTSSVIPGLAEARLRQTQIDRSALEVETEIINVVTAINGYDAQIKALQSTSYADDSEEHNLLQGEISQLYGFLAEQNSKLMIAMDKARILKAEQTELRDALMSKSVLFQFENYFIEYFTRCGYTHAEAKTLAHSLYAKFVRYVRQQSYTEENITIEDGMTYEQKSKQELALYNYATNLLEKLIIPSYELTIDVSSFPFIRGFSDVANDLDVGSIINVEVNENEVTEFNLLEIQVNYDDKSISLIFSNHFNRADPAAMFEDLQATTSSAASIIASNYIEWGATVDKTTQLMSERNSILDATLRGITARNSSMQDNVSITTAGIKCTTQKINEADKWVDDYGLWITNGVIMFTDDGWNSSKMAVGRLVLPNGDIKYGFNGDVILAHTISADKIAVGALSKGTNLIKDGSFESYRTATGSEFEIKQDGIWKAYYKSGDDYIAWPYPNNHSVGSTGFVMSVDETSASVGYASLLTQIHGTIQLRYSEPINIKGGMPYTLSFYVKTGTKTSLNEDDYVKVFVDNENLSDMSVEVTRDDISGSDGWKRFSVTASADEDTVLDQEELVIELYGESTLSLSGSWFRLDGIMLEQSLELNDYTPYIEETCSKYVLINEDGINIFDGKIAIHNVNGDRVLQADSDGNLSITGTLTAESGSSIAGWVTDDNGFYKLVVSQSDSSYKYPKSGLFAGGTYSVVNNKFSSDPGNYYYPLLFTGYNGSGPIDLNSCNFFVDHNGKMKSIDATITGSVTDSSRYELTKLSPSRYLINSSQQAPADVVVAVDGVIQAQVEDRPESSVQEEFYGIDVVSNIYTIANDIAPVEISSLRKANQMPQGLNISGARLLTQSEATSLISTQSDRSYSDKWWLSTPTSLWFVRAVESNGMIDTGNSYNAYSNLLYVRPALVITNLSETSYTIGSVFSIGSYSFKVISNELAWMYNQDIGRSVFAERGSGSIPDEIPYEGSLVQSFVDEWFESLDTTELVYGTDYTYTVQNSTGVITLTTQPQLTDRFVASYEDPAYNYGYSYSISVIEGVNRGLIKFNFNTDDDSDIFVTSTSQNRGANITYANLEQVSINSAIISNAIISGGIKISDATISKAEIYDSNLNVARVKNYILFKYDAGLPDPTNSENYVGFIKAKESTWKYYENVVDENAGASDEKYKKSEIASSTYRNLLLSCDSITIKANTETATSSSSTGFQSLSNMVLKHIKKIKMSINQSGVFGKKTLDIVDNQTEMQDVLIERTKPIYLDGTVYVRGLSKAAGISFIHSGIIDDGSSGDESDIVTVVNDIYNRIAILSASVSAIAFASGVADVTETFAIVAVGAGLVVTGIATVANFVLTLFAISAIEDLRNENQ